MGLNQVERAFLARRDAERKRIEMSKEQQRVANLLEQAASVEPDTQTKAKLLNRAMQAQKAGWAFVEIINERVYGYPPNHCHQEEFKTLSWPSQFPPAHGTTHEV